MDNSIVSNEQEAFDQALGIYNPGSLPANILLDQFIARRHQLDKALDIVRNNQKREPQQHLLVIGPRGMGKTMLLLALAYSVQKDKELEKEWLPVIFPEETYGIGDLADFWLSLTEHLLQTLGKEGDLSAVDRLREQNPDDIEAQAQALFLKYQGESQRRVLVILENMHHFFEAVSDEAEQHRLRAFLMEDDRLMVAASSPTYFDATGQMEMPFYDFFRIMRLERFGREEMIDVFRHLAAQRNDTHVEDILQHQPERIDSLRVLTGGNPRLVKMVYRLLSEGGTGSARQDLDRLIEDCTPYFKHRIEELSGEVRRVFDHVAKQWDPVAVGDIQKALRRPSNKISIYLRRLMNEGFLEESAGATPKRKMYQVAERFYNIYYLMRFSRSGRRRLSWLVQAMRVLYSEADFTKWADETLVSWKNSKEPNRRADHEAFLYSLTRASDCVGMQSDLVEKTIETAWETDQLDCLNRLLDREMGQLALGNTFDLISFFASLPAETKKHLDYKPKEAWWWVQLSTPLKEQGLYAAAEIAYRRAIELNPKLAHAWCHLGHLQCTHLGKYKEAEAAYCKAIELNPKLAHAWRCLGSLLCDHFGKYEEAEEAYRRAVELDPKYVCAWCFLGNLLRDHFDKYEEAEAAYRKAIEIDPNFAYAWYFLGSLLCDHFDKYEEAEAAYRKAIEIDPKNAHAWRGLGNLLSDHFDKYEEAEAAYRKAIEIDPKSVYAWLYLGNLLRDHFDKFEEAEAAYRKAIEIDSMDVYTYFELSNLLSQINRTTEAAELALRALLLAPENPWSRNHFLELCGDKPEMWKQVLPRILEELAKDISVVENEELEGGLDEFTMRGLEVVLSSKALSFSDALSMIHDAGAEEVLEPIVIMLRAAEDETVLAKASPEHRLFAEEFLAKVGGLKD